jgi:hypothetical protein
MSGCGRCVQALTVFELLAPPLLLAARRRVDLHGRR